MWRSRPVGFEDFVYDGPEMVTPAALPGLWERTVTVFSLSKGYGLSGLRVGYLVAHDEVMDRLYGAAVNVSARRARRPSWPPSPRSATRVRWSSGTATSRRAGTPSPTCSAPCRGCGWPRSRAATSAGST